MTGSASRERALAAAAGVAAALLGIGAGELAATLLAPSSSPLVVVGGVLIDAAPAWAKDTAIAWFGTGDKAALLTGIAIVLLAAAAALGLCEQRWRSIGVTGFVVLGAVVAVIAPLRADAAPLSWLPALLAGVVAAVVLRMLVRRLPVSATAPTPDSAAHAAPPAHAAPAVGDGTSRRRFLAWTVGTAAIGILAAVAATAGRAGSVAVGAVRAALHLPKPAAPAPPIPAGAALKVDGITPLVTPNADFYRIDTALIVPQVDPAQWKLRIHGLVAHEVTLTWDELLALPLVESAATLSCVSNEVGGDLVGNAVWLGYPIRELLAKAQPSADADMVLSTSVDGFTAGTPLETLTDDRDALLAIGMNGQPLPFEHGFPVRMVVPGLYGYVSATKWVTDLEVTRFDRVLDGSGLVRPRPDQALLAHRRAAPEPPDPRRRHRDRRRGLAAARRGLRGRGAGRRRPLAARRARPGDLRRHLGAVAAPLDRRRGAARAPLPGDRRRRHGADRADRRPRPRRCDRLAHGQRDRERLTPARGRSSRNPCASLPSRICDIGVASPA
jgi:DMSO/TMAO reductase YedYZ molybdopterin-dependent catalytic subunit/uncharacterized membrane protein YhaH (DUF805 family)